MGRGFDNASVAAGARTSALAQIARRGDRGIVLRCLGFRMVEVGHLGCVRSGFCCQRAPCAYGAPATGSGCRYLESDESEAGFTTYRCGRYEWILANVPDWRSHPAFGAGCNAPLFNPNRE